MTATPAFDLVSVLREHDLSVATGESLTAGLVSAAIADVPGCSAVHRGGVIAYQAEVKHRLLGVPQEVLQRGVVTAEVATALAIGARQALGADVGIGTTGAAGPESHDGAPPGTAWIAVAIRGEEPRTERVTVSGNRSQVREAVTQRALELAVRALSHRTPPGRE